MAHCRLTKVHPPLVDRDVDSHHRTLGVGSSPT